MFLASICFAQQSRMLHWGVDEGLPGSTVYCSLQDGKGFMWFGTDQGLCRFDGTNFKTYTVDDGLPDNDVFWMARDSRGRIWIICFNKTPCYLQNGVIHQFHFNDNNEVTTPGEFPSAILCAPDGSVFILFPKALITLNADLQVKDKCNFNSHAIDMITIGNAAIVETDDSLFRVLAGEKHFLYAPTGGESIAHGVCVNGDVLYFILSNGIVRRIVSLNLKNNNSLKTITADCGQVFKLSCLSDSTIRTVSQTNISVTNINSLQQNHVLYMPQLISCVFEDRDSNTWVGSAGKGVFMMPPGGVKIYNNANDNNNALSICGNGNGTVAVGYRSSDLDIIESDAITRHIQYPDKRDLFRILKIKWWHGNFYLGTDHSLLMLDNRFSFTDVFPDTVRGNVKGFDFTRDGEILVANAQWAFSLHKGPPDFFKEILLQQRTTAIAAISNRVYVIGTIYGLYFNSYGKAYKYNADAVLAASRVSGITTDTKNKIWVSTMQNGVFVIDSSGVGRITTKQGLSGNICKNIFADEDDNIWICTNTGLNEIVQKANGTFKCLLFDASYGLPTNEINDVYVNRGNVWVATAHGVASFQQQAFRRTLPIYILSFYAHDSLYDMNTAINLSYLHNDIRVDYAGISYTAAKNIKYKYLLKGSYEADTIFTRAGSIRFAALSPGSYTLFVWAADNNNIWSITPAIVKFSIYPPFWKTTWFYLLCIVSSVAGIVLLLAYRVRAISKKEREKTDVNKRISELELQALRAQMNPHFIFNALNSIQSFYANNDEIAANKFMTTFSSLIRQILNSSGKSLISVKDEIALLTNYIELEKMRFKDKFGYTITMDNQITAENVFLPILLIQPFVENAINHGLRFVENGKGELNLSFKKQSKLLICIIDDNGIGLKSSLAKKKANGPAHASAAMKITHSRIDSLNVIYDNVITIKFIDKHEMDINTTGLTVIITLPIMKETLNDIWT